MDETGAEPLGRSLSPAVAGLLMVPVPSIATPPARALQEARQQSFVHITVFGDVSAELLRDYKLLAGWNHGDFCDLLESNGLTRAGDEGQHARR